MVDWFVSTDFLVMHYFCFNICQHGRQILYFKLHVHGHKFHYQWPHVAVRLQVVHHWARQSHMRQGCHCWELQDEPFVFCRQISTACVDLQNRVFSVHLIVFLLRVTKKERKSTLKHWGIMSCQGSVSWADAQGSVSCKWAQIHCSRWRLQVPGDGIPEWKKSEQRGSYMDW